MKCKAKTSFARRLKKIKNPAVLINIKSAIRSVEAAASLQDIPNLKKLKGSKKGDSFRIKVDDWRIGVIVENQTVVFIACDNRKDFYKYFP